MNCKHLLITVISLCSLTASGQIAKGSVFLGGSLYFASQSYEADHLKNTTLGLFPAIGKAIKKNLIAGVDVTYMQQRQVRSDSAKDKDQSIGAGVFIRKYAAIGKGFYIFGHARAGGSYRTVEYDYPPFDDGKGYAIDISAYPGISYEINRKLHVEAGLANLFQVNYSTIKHTRENGTSYKNKNFGVSTSLSNGAALSVGVRFLIAS